MTVCDRCRKSQSELPGISIFRANIHYGNNATMIKGGAEICEPCLGIAVEAFNRAVEPLPKIKETK